ncbi:hypothetical protein [Embleya sp. AB8]|uniref:hypothetical protein n=1 Tax=Embleya sp. AB8 TaxID=3156304 RepID=UPI003C72B66D
MLATNSRIPAGRSGAEEDFARYRDVVADIFARHLRTVLPGVDGALCSCGNAWPCREELLAAELLDWI